MTILAVAGLLLLGLLLIGLVGIWFALRGIRIDGPW